MSKSVPLSQLPASLKAKAIALQNDRRANDFAALCEGAGLPAFVREHRYIPHRKHALDFAWPSYKVGVESDGGIWQRGGHSTGKGILAGMDKSNLGLLHGWAVIRVVPATLATPSTVEMVKRLIAMRS